MDRNYSWLSELAETDPRLANELEFEIFVELLVEEFLAAVAYVYDGHVWHDNSGTCHLCAPCHGPCYKGSYPV